MTEDPRLKAARYRVSGGDAEPAEGDEQAMMSAEQRAAYVEVALAQAARRGDFDDLPGAGKPLKGLGGTHDPDWWIRRKIEREQLSGLGPPALTLRVENTQLDERLDALGAESAVREVLDDFNRRVVEARRQLLGGPPVVTPTRDPDSEIARWHERRAERAREAAAAAQASEAESAERRRWGSRFFGRRRTG